MYKKLNISISVPIFFLIVFFIKRSKKWYDLPSSVSGFAEVLIVFNQLILSISVISVYSIVNFFELKEESKIVAFVSYLLLVNSLFLKYFDLKLFLIVFVILFLFTYSVLYKVNWTSKGLFFSILSFYLLAFFWYFITEML